MIKRVLVEYQQHETPGERRLERLVRDTFEKDDPGNLTLNLEAARFVLQEAIYRLGSRRTGEDASDRALRIACVAAAALAQLSPELITAKQATQYFLVKLRQYRTVYPESPQYDQSLSYVGWRSRLMVHIGRMESYGKLSRNLKLFANIGVMALAAYQAFDVAKRIAANVKAQPVSVRLEPRTAEQTIFGVPVSEEIPTSERRYRQLCRLCFRAGQFEIAPKVMENPVKWSHEFYQLCTKHHSESLQDGHLCLHVTPTSRRELHKHVATMNGLAGEVKASNIVETARGPVDLDEVASKVEGLISGTTVVRPAFAVPRWVREALGDEPVCDVRYCNAVAQVTIDNNRMVSPAVPTVRRQTCSQHIAHGILLDCVATVVQI